MYAFANRRRWSACLVCLLVAIATGGNVRAGVSAPYVNDFTSANSTNALASSAGAAAWMLDTGAVTFGSASFDGVYGHVTNNGTYTAALSVTNLGGSPASALNFVVSGTVAATNGAGTGSYISLVALADNAALTNDYRIQLFYASPSNTNGFRLIKSTAGADSILTNVGTSAIQLRYLLNRPVTLTLTGTYVGTSLRLDAVLYTNDALACSISYVDSSPFTGNWFGIRDVESNVNQQMGVFWDTFTVIPEPASLAMFLLGAAPVYLLARRRS